jgi:putative chitinase
MTENPYLLSPAVLVALKGSIPNKVVYQLPSIAAIATPLRLAHFLAQCAHESDHFKVASENLNYSAEGLKATFPSYFPGRLSESYAKNPARIGARVYANRMGNGDEASGDGYSYRGRGYIQLTGKANYALFGEVINADTVANPDLVASHYALASAGFFFDLNDVWSLCDRGSSAAAIMAVTKKVNGGTHGLAERARLFTRFYGVLHS